jgi:hypothetical protein
MVYHTISTKEIVSKIIRDARLNNLTYADYIFEWIGDAVDQITVKWRLPKTYKKITITDHTAELPCELVSIEAVVYNGTRLRYGSTDLDPKALNNYPTCESILTSYFISDPTDQAYKNQQSYALLRGEDLKPALSTWSSMDFYQIEPGYIKTSFQEGDIYIFYRHRPVDKFGLPIIPDVKEAREGIFWFVVSKLIFSGYSMPDGKITYDYADKKATRLLKKAKNSIKALNKDEKEQAIQMWVNLVPPQGYYADFFLDVEQPKTVGISSR